MPVRHFVAASVAALLLVGCASPQASPPAKISYGSQATPEAVVQKVFPKPEAAKCRDKLGDGGSADIKKVSVVTRGSKLRLTVELTTPLRYSETAGLFLNVASKSGDKAGQYGIKWIKGERVSTFFFEDEQSNLYLLPSTNKKGKYSVAFPASYIRTYDKNWNWSLTSAVNGVDQDSCGTKHSL